MYRANVQNQSVAFRGFTMIELLMVIIIISTLGFSAVGEMLDFRKEGRLASVRMILSALRVGIKNQTQNVMLRCNAATPVRFTAMQVFVFNSVVNTSAIPSQATTCTTTHLPRAEDQRFVDPSMFTTLTYTTFSGTNSWTYIDNPFGNDGYMTCQGAGCTSRCSVGCGTGITTFGWCFNENTMEIWPATNVASECEL